MSDAAACPVCGFSNFREDRETCPQCDADLACFRLLENLSETSPSQKDRMPDPPAPETFDRVTAGAGEQAAPSTEEKIPGGGGRGIRMGAAAAVVLAIVLVSGVGAFHLSSLTASVDVLNGRQLGLNGRLSALDKRLSALDERLLKVVSGLEHRNRQINGATRVSQNIQDTVNRIDNRIEKMAHHIKQVNNRVENAVKIIKKESARQLAVQKAQDTARERLVPDGPCMKEYRATDADTLWGIARDLLGSGVYYPVLMACNPHLNIFSISSRDRVKYPCDKTKVPDIYRQVTAVKHNRRYLKYTVRPGDTPRSVTNRYCSKKTGCLVKGFSFETGATIGIFLE